MANARGGPAVKSREPVEKVIRVASGPPGPSLRCLTHVDAPDRLRCGAWIRTEMSRNRLQGTTSSDSWTHPRAARRLDKSEPRGPAPSQLLTPGPPEWSASAWNPPWNPAPREERRLRDLRHEEGPVADRGSTTRPVRNSSDPSRSLEPTGAGTPRAPHEPETHQGRTPDALGSRITADTRSNSGNPGHQGFRRSRDPCRRYHSGGREAAELLHPGRGGSGFRCRR